MTERDNWLKKTNATVTLAVMSITGISNRMSQRSRLREHIQVFFRYFDLLLTTAIVHFIHDICKVSGGNP